MLKKTNKRKLWKYTLFGFLALSILSIPTTLLLIHYNDLKKQEEYSKIRNYAFWNFNGSIFTKEGGSPQVFAIDKDKIPDEDKRYLEHIEINNYTPGSGFGFYHVFKYYNNLTYDNLHNKKFPKWKTKNIQSNSYLFKNKDDFINLLKKNQPNYYTSDTVILNDYAELLSKINFESHDLLMLNNFLGLKLAWSDNRKLGWNISDYNLDINNKKIVINFEYNDKVRKFLFTNDFKWGVHGAFGNDEWYKTYFLIVPKSGAKSAEELNIEFAYK